MDWRTDCFWNIDIELSSQSQSLSLQVPMMPPKLDLMLNETMRKKERRRSPPARTPIAASGRLKMRKVSVCPGCSAPNFRPRSVNMARSVDLNTISGLIWSSTRERILLLSMGFVLYGTLVAHALLAGSAVLWELTQLKERQRMEERSWFCWRMRSASKRPNLRCHLWMPREWPT